MRNRFTLLAVSACVLLGPAALADTLNIDRSGIERDQGRAMPARGVSMQQVLRNYGEPVRRHAPVGSPPITRWEYPTYIVFFEYSHVIHSVEKRPNQPQ